ncbi:hypothetical protein IJJ46_03095 [Candidatus Saccharibacteria bacterium]|nr:hypothetical protein [Candidatus Saccharibacteria bacterium]
MSAFKFKNYDFDYQTLVANFRYVGADGTEFCEKVQFARPAAKIPNDDQQFVYLLDSALFLAFYLIGTSYYKSRPTRRVESFGLNKEQARFFSIVYQDGLSQYAFENHLTRADLATFKADSPASLAERKNLRQKLLGNIEYPELKGFTDSSLILQSGGKDSLLNSELHKNTPHSYWYLSSSKNHPRLLDQLDQPLQHAIRTLDHEGLQKSKGFNGHVPVTYIVMSLALVQAILNRQKTVLTSIGQEGAEAHAIIRKPGKTARDFAKVNDGDLPVNHQWSKTADAEKLFRAYVHQYISPELDVYSPLREYTELKIAQLFAEKCWQKYGKKFSSCNVANYAQGKDNSNLKWCGNCAKCANSYLLFAPFVPRRELDDLFGGLSPFENPELTDDFEGLLGINDKIKPFECVGEIDELRYAYHHRLPEYPDLPFTVPRSDFNIERKS